MIDERLQMSYYIVCAIMICAALRRMLATDYEGFTEFAVDVIVRHCCEFAVDVIVRHCL